MKGALSTNLSQVSSNSPGPQCLSYFSNLTKLGSVNARPVYLLMLAMKSPSREGFKQAIDACAEASMVHLEAMAKERYAVFLNGESDAELANDYITSSFWLYQDYGAYAKALQLKERHDFLKVRHVNSCLIIHAAMSHLIALHFVSWRK